MIRLAPVFAVVLFLTPGVWAVEPLPAEADSAFERGVHAVVGCIGCHWQEDDRIARADIPTVCGDCHPGPHDDYGTSVHWDDGRAHAVCIDCHGNHGILPVADPRSRAHRSLVCGTCHTGPAEELRSGPHWEGFERTNALVCASCHDNHAVVHPTIGRIEPACESCHARDTSAFAFGQDVETRFDRVRDLAEETRRKLDNASDAGYRLEEARRALETGRGRFTEARLIWHSLDGDRIEEKVAETEDAYDRALAGIRERIDIQERREQGVWLAWGLVGLAVLALHLKRRSLDRED